MSQELLDEQRRLMFEALEKLRSYNDSPQAQELMNLIMGRARGDSAPFNPNVLAGMYGRNADAAAGMFRNQADMIRQAFGNRGLGGSGLETSAMLDAQQRAAGQVRSGRREIRTRAELENFGAMERAQAQAQAYLAQKNAEEAMIRMKEIDLRSQFHTTDQKAQAKAGAPPRPVSYGMSNAIIPNRMKTVTTPAGFSGGGGFSSHQVFDPDAYNRDMERQIMDRAYLQQLQADWDARYGG